LSFNSIVSPKYHFFDFSILEKIQKCENAEEHFPQGRLNWECRSNYLDHHTERVGLPSFLLVLRGDLMTEAGPAFLLFAAILLF
jgi:hypothetical protein